MILEYSDIKQIFVQNEYNKISGGDLSNAQIFYSNRWIEKEVGETSLFAYDTPMYTTIGGTLNYYGQDINSIFTNTYRPSIRFNFSANTDSFGTGTTIVHNIYKIINGNGNVGLKTRVDRNTTFRTGATRALWVLFGVSLGLIGVVVKMVMAV